MRHSDSMDVKSSLRCMYVKSPHRSLSNIDELAKTGSLLHELIGVTRIISKEEHAFRDFSCAKLTAKNEHFRDISTF